MITDTLQNLPRYKGLNANLDTAIAWLAGHDLADLPLGKTVVDGEKVFINVMEADLRPAAGATYEYHRRYADLQVDITGAEAYEWAETGTPAGDYDADGDAGFVAGPAAVTGTLGDGKCALFVPGEPHKPSCINGDCTHVRKAVFKIEMA